MPNVLDAEPARAFARRAGAKIDDERIRARFEKLAFDRLMADARNFRAATEADMRKAPAWAQCVAARGEDLFAFKLSRSASVRLHNLARWLQATSALALADTARHRHLRGVIQDARAFVTKIERASIDVIGQKALRFARAQSRMDKDEDFEPLCPAQVVAGAAGRIWSRVTSVAELRAVGREFRNCLARTSHGVHYGAGLRWGLRQFWVLRDAAGGGLIALMADAPTATHFIEVRGPRNTQPRGYAADLARLGAAIGIAPNNPPPVSRARRARARCTCLNCGQAPPGPRTAALLQEPQPL